ncbi:MAG: polyphosphate kinase 2 family protein [Chitinophagaceae bacterium]
MAAHPFRVDSKKKIHLNEFSTSSGHSAPVETELKARLSKYIENIAALQYKLYAENRQSLLIILQGMDSAGKDGTIKHIMSGVNPEGVEVSSFKHPSTEELEHDYLWRHYIKLPQKGQITIFNRSHYENVLVSRVHPEIVLSERIPGVESLGKIDRKFWERRYHQINQFEKTTVQNGTKILKFFLHLSKEEQRKRFLERIEKRKKHWKFSSNDIQERSFWKDYQKAYEEAISNTSTKNAPWFIIPADDKWNTHLLIGEIILETLEWMNPIIPSLDKKEEALMKQAKLKLMGEAKGSS